MFKGDREALGALWGAIFLFLNYIVTAVSIARAAGFAQGGPWRILAALTALAAYPSFSESLSDPELAVYWVQCRCDSRIFPRDLLYWHQC